MLDTSDFWWRIPKTIFSRLEQNAYACGVYFSSLSISTAQQTRIAKSFLRARENATQYERSSVKDERWIGISPLVGQEICVRRFLCGKHVVLAKVTMAHRHHWFVALLVLGSSGSHLAAYWASPSLSSHLCTCVCVCVCALFIRDINLNYFFSKRSPKSIYTPIITRIFTRGEKWIAPNVAWRVHTWI